MIFNEAYATLAWGTGPALLGSPAREAARGQGLRRQRREGRHVRRRAILQGSGVNAVQVRAAEQVWMTLDLLARHRRGRQIDRRHCSRCGDDGRHARRAPAALFGSRRPHQRRVASDRALSRPFVLGRCRRAASSIRRACFKSHCFLAFLTGGVSESASPRLMPPRK
jgi:hypothetical protein